MAGAALRAIAAAILAVIAAGASAADLHVYSSGAPAEAAKSIGADFSRSSGHQVVVTVGPPATIQKDLAGGDTIDVVILPRPVVSMLTSRAVLRSEGAIDVARVGIGVAVRTGTPATNVADAAAIRQLLTDAHSVAYPDPGESGGGSAGLAIARMIDKLGLTDTVRPKLTVRSAIDGGVALVASGKVEIGIFNVSEILPVKGVTMVGPLPAELQTYILFTAAVPSKSIAPEPALAYIKRLGDPAVAPVWQKAGLEPLNTAR